MQNDKETVTRHYTVDYLSTANRDIFVTEDGSYTSRYVYDASGRRGGEARNTWCIIPASSSQLSAVSYSRARAPLLSAV